MEKVLIADNNLCIGGIQKAFVGLLSEISKEYDITLMLFSKHGELLSDIPQSIQIFEAHGMCDLLGLTQSETKTRGLLKMAVRTCAAAFSRLFGNAVPINLVVGNNIHKKNYDYAISFMHFQPNQLFNGGTNEYILNCVKARTKITFVHCDFLQYGGNTWYTRRMYKKFDRVAVCSGPCMERFLEAIPVLRNKTYVVRNCNPYDDIRKQAANDPVIYATDILHVVTVARLSEEKALERGIEAVAECRKKGIRVQYHLIGDGPEKENLEQKVKLYGLEDYVIFYGNQKNPYRYMMNADLFLLPSRHEAAPMVFDEARCLGLPILATKTVSTDEMIINAGAGWVCENSTKGVKHEMLRLLATPKLLVEKKQDLAGLRCDNTEAIRQFKAMLEGRRLSADC